MEIINNKYNSLPEQVEENMKNIKLLAEYLKEAYRTNNKAEISQDSISIAISLTNAPEDTTNGWLLDGRGNLFKITGGDGYALLLDFYSDIRGVKGEDGATLQIDDDNTSLIKVWSSLKTNSEIEKAKDKGIYYTNVEPTLVGGVLRVTLSDILNISNDIPIKYKDLIIYTDGTNAKALYIVKSTGTIVINTQVEKICDFGGGGVEGGNVWHTWHKANFIDGEATFSIGDIIKPNDIPLSVADKILYVDGNDNIIECYMILDIGDISVTLEKIGNVGKQLYQHNVRVLFDTQPYLVLFDITNDNPNNIFTSSNDLVTYLLANNFIGTSFSLSTKVLRASGSARNTILSQEMRDVRGLYTRPNLSNSIYAIGLNASGSFIDMQVVATDIYIEENVDTI